MSELTTCNYCNLQEYKRRAKREGCRIVLRPGWGGGTDVFKVKQGEELPDGTNVTDSELRDKYLISWMMEIGSRCSC